MNPQPATGMAISGANKDQLIAWLIGERTKLPDELLSDSENFKNQDSVKTRVIVNQNENYILIDSCKEEEIHSYYDETWKAQIHQFEKEVILKQLVKIKTGEKFAINGTVNYITCKDGSCLPPTDYVFEIIINE